MGASPYSTDLTDAEWSLIEPLLPGATPGSPPDPDLRLVINGIFFLMRSGSDFWICLERMALAGPLALRGKTRLLKRPVSASRYANPHRPGISWACGLRTQADVIHSKSADRLATNVRRGLASWFLLSACVL